ncbi:DUF3558 family protein [Lentzea sp. NPDC006480]|uniref:DUF3558 family protein n=1 Tax=Lentzea sp. NPDC006480 TaxID=3157176 RepID=UPI0033B72F29
MKRILIVTLIGFAALTAGCTGTKGTPTTTTTSGGSTPTSSSDSASGLGSVKPCELLTDSEAGGLGFSVPGEPEKSGTGAGCDWEVAGDGGLLVSVRTDKGLNDLNVQGDNVSKIKVGKFTATKVEADNGSKASCTIIIGVTEKSSVSVLSTLKLTSEDTAASCQRASKAADLIAPKL